MNRSTKDIGRPSVCARARLATASAASAWLVVLLLIIACGNQAPSTESAASGSGSSGRAGPNAAPSSGGGSGAGSASGSSASGSGSLVMDDGGQRASEADAMSSAGSDAAPAGASSEGGAPGSDAGGSSTPPTGVFPAVTDPGVAGPFTPTTTGSTGPGGAYTAFYPKELGQGGVKNPIVIWGDGATLTPTSYLTLIDHLASHGFAILAYNATPQASDMTKAIDWMVSESARQGSVFYGKLDTTKIASMGHSAGSLATFAIANDPRLTTTMHLDGGTMSPHTDAKNLVKPAAFICGDSGGDGLITGDLARPNCDIDFQNATTPVWYGDIIGASHLTVTGTATDPKVKAFMTATAAWLRWQLAADQTMKAFFVPSGTCTLCTQTALWTVQEKNLP
jgi:hypothetical protein